MVALISGHSVQKSIAIHFHPCNPVLVPQNTCSIMFCGIFLSHLLAYLVVFGNIMWKLENSNFYDQPWLSSKCPCIYLWCFSLPCSGWSSCLWEVLGKMASSADKEEGLWTHDKTRREKAAIWGKTILALVIFGILWTWCQKNYLFSTFGALALFPLNRIAPVLQF